jgi:hypothetical protein
MKLYHEHLECLLSNMEGVVVDDETASDYRTYEHFEYNFLAEVPEDEIVLEISLVDNVYEFTTAELLNAEIAEDWVTLVVTPVNLQKTQFDPVKLKFFTKAFIPLPPSTR